MSECDDENYESEDKADALAERAFEESMSWESDCSDRSDKSYWKLVNISNLVESCYGYEEDDDSDANKIRDYRELDVLNHFSDIPDTLTACHDTEAIPDSVEFKVYHGPFSDTGDYHFEDPLPDDNDGSDGGGIVEKLVTIGAAVGSAASGNYAIAAAGLVVGYISGRGGDPVDYEKTENNETQTCYWDIAAIGSSESDFPSDPCDSAGVQIRIDVGNTGEFVVNAGSSWTFEYKKYGRDECCDDGYRSAIKTTSWVTNQFDIESPEDPDC
jgi:hypothetical protein